MPNFCTTCGSPLKPGQKFCTTCGAEIKSSAAEAPQRQRQKHSPVICTSCGAAAIPKAKFCIKCGSEIAASASASHRPYKQGICPSCGAFANPDAKFCTKCGTEFGKEMTMEPVVIPVEGEPYSVTVSNEPVLENTVAENLCNACGLPLNPNAKFCTKCGAKAQPAANREQNKATGEKWTQAAKKVVEMLEQTLDASDYTGEMRIPVNRAQKSAMWNFIKSLKL